MKVEHKAWVVVADGRKAIVAQNIGALFEPKLDVRSVLEAEPNPPTQAQGSDRPGRTHDSTSARRSAVGQTDWHDQAESAFARRTADALEQLCRTEAVEQLILIAAPRTLASLREALSPHVRSRTVVEIDKDLTNHPVREIEKALADL